MRETPKINTNDRHFYNVFYSAINQKKIPVFTPSIPRDLVGAKLNSKLPLQTLETATTPQEAFLKPYCDRLQNKCLDIGNSLINSLAWAVSYQDNPHHDSQPKAIFEGPIEPIELIPEFIESIPEPSAEWFEAPYEPTYEETAELGELFPEVDPFFEDSFVLESEVIVENGEEVIICDELLRCGDDIVFQSEDIVFEGDDAIFQSEDIVFEGDDAIFQSEDIIFEGEVDIEIFDEVDIKIFFEKLKEQWKQEQWEKYDFTDKSPEQVQEIKQLFQDKIDNIKQQMLDNGISESDIYGSEVEGKSRKNFCITIHNIDGFEITWDGQENYMELISDVQIVEGLDSYRFVKPASESGRVQILDATPTTNIKGKINPRNYDTEFVALDETLEQLDKLGAKFDETTGEILIYTEIKPCTSCRNSRVQFQEYYPNIKVIFLDGKGKIW